jgi:hypothetical protein
MKDEFLSQDLRAVDDEFRDSLIPPKETAQSIRKDLKLLERRLDLGKIRAPFIFVIRTYAKMTSHGHTGEVVDSCIVYDPKKNPAIRHHTYVTIKEESGNETERKLPKTDIALSHECDISLLYIGRFLSEFYSSVASNIILGEIDFPYITYCSEWHGERGNGYQENRAGIEL